MPGSSLIRSYGDTDFITGIRAIAASMVVIIHTGALAEFGTVGQALTGAGKYGVDVFFVLSGFTVAKTFSEARDYRSYLTRRIARILPIYWVVILLCFVLALSGVSVSPWMSRYGAEPDAYNLLMHLSFLSFLDYRVANALLGVEWTIPVEVFWYIALPVFLARVASIRYVLAASLIMLAVSAILAWVFKESVGTSQPAKWTPMAYGHYFLIGAYAHSYRSQAAAVVGDAQTRAARIAATLAVISLFVVYPGRGEIIALSTAVLLACLSAERSPVLNAVLTVRPMLFLGSVSYSIYLIHLLTIAALSALALSGLPGPAWFALVYSITVLVSALTYRLIERPTNDWGRRLVERLARRATGQKHLS